jgi:V8-like Glu-specific endopeptidase
MIPSQRPLHLLISPLLLAAFLGSACATTPACPPRGHQSRGRALARQLTVLNGRLDVENRYSETIMVSAGIGACSGVLIAPRVVLTAGHCVCKQKQIAASGGECKTIIDGSVCAETATVTTVAYEEAQQGSRAKSRTEDYAGKVRPHPEFKILLDAQNNVVSSNADLAVILLDDPVAEEFPAVPLASSEVSVDEAIVLVGYGYEKTTGGLLGKRRSGKNKVVKIYKREPGGTEFRAGLSSTQNIYGGDSGGPCLREDGQQVGLVGIASAYETDTEGREFSVFTSTYAYREWLLKEIEAASTD